MEVIFYIFLLLSLEYSALIEASEFPSLNIKCASASVSKHKYSRGEKYRPFPAPRLHILQYLEACESAGAVPSFRIWCELRL